MADKFYQSPKTWIFDVVEEPEVEAAVDAACKKHKHAEDMFRALTWRIARDHHCGVQIEDSEPFRRVLKLKSIKGIKSPAMVARFYQYDENTKIVDWIKFYPYDESSADEPMAYVFKPSC